MPDITFLKENQEHVRALILTHGHEDHIGAVPYFLSDIDVPVYGTAFTLALVERRLEEHELEEEPRLITVKPKQIVQIGPFKIEFIHVTHSIVSARRAGHHDAARRHHPHRRFQGGSHAHR
jgi:ribonuclease J